MQQNIYFQKKVWDKFKDEPDKSKLINELLAKHFAGELHTFEWASGKKISEELSNPFREEQKAINPVLDIPQKELDKLEPGAVVSGGNFVKRVKQIDKKIIKPLEKEAEAHTEQFKTYFKKGKK